MKKYLNALLILAGFTLCACGSKKKAKPVAPEKETIVHTMIQNKKDADKKEDYSIVS